MVLQKFKELSNQSSPLPLRLHPWLRVAYKTNFKNMYIYKHSSKYTYIYIKQREVDTEDCTS